MGAGLCGQGLPGAQKMYEGVEMLAPIRKKPGKKLTDAEKASNKAHSRIRVYVEHAIRKVKTWRIMGDRYRNPLKKYDRINDVVCGLVNLVSRITSLLLIRHRNFANHPGSLRL